LRIFLTRTKPELDEEDLPTVTKIKATAVKNTCGGIAYRKAEFTLRFGRGIALEDDVLDAGLKAGVVTRAVKGGTHTLRLETGPEVIGRSRDAALVWLAAKSRAQKIREAITKTDWYVGEPNPVEEGEPEGGGETEEIPQAGGDGQGIGS
jgi:hypothetical protein